MGMSLRLGPRSCNSTSKYTRGNTCYGESVWRRLCSPEALGKAMKIPGYSIQRQIGQGGMATVYYAIQESLERPVALKVMNPLLADRPEFSQRFLNEGRLLAALRHSHIITIYDIGVSDQYHYISMEYVDGGDLKQRLLHGLAPLLALDYVITLGHCLKAAHDLHIVHRDIKPVNILFRRDDTLLLTDFGVAKNLASYHGTDNHRQHGWQPVLYQPRASAGASPGWPGRYLQPRHRLL